MSDLTTFLMARAIRTVLAGERVRHDPECRDPSCKLCEDVTGPLVDYEVLAGEEDARD